MLQASTNAVISRIYQVVAPAAGAAETKSQGGKRRKTGAKTIGAKFRQDLSSLMQSIRSTSTHYVRCIKSNHQKMPGVFDSKYVLDQLRTAGVFSAAEIRSRGFPCRKSHKAFRRHFSPIAASAKFSSEDDDKVWCESFVKHVAALPSSDTVTEGGLDASQILVGSSQVLYRGSESRLLESLRAFVLSDAATLCQKIARGFLARSVGGEKE